MMKKEWFYFLENRDQVITVWRVPLQTGLAADKPIDIKNERRYYLFGGGKNNGTYLRKRAIYYFRVR